VITLRRSLFLIACLAGLSGLTAAPAPARAAESTRPEAQTVTDDINQLKKSPGDQALKDLSPRHLAAWRTEAQRGNADALYLLGRCYEVGAGVSRDEVAAFALELDAARQGSVPAMVALAAMYRDGRGVPADRVKSTQWLDAAARGTPLAEPAAKSPSAAQIEADSEPEDLQATRKAAEAGDVEAMFNLGLACEHGKQTILDYREAAIWYQRAVAQGHRTAMNNLAWMYHRGQGVPRNEQEAFRLFKQSASAGEPVGMFGLAAAYRDGQGTRQDYAEAIRWMRQGADSGLPLAMNGLADMYRQGQGVAKDEAAAVQLYQKCHSIGDPWGTVGLGKMYETGTGGLAQSDQEAIKLYREAADAGNEYGYYHYGRMLETGRGTPANLTEAKQWYAKAAEAGLSEAIKALARLK
jgi:uncharacterized protein